MTTAIVNITAAPDSRWKITYRTTRIVVGYQSPSGEAELRPGPELFTVATVAPIAAYAVVRDDNGGTRPVALSDEDIAYQRIPSLSEATGWDTRPPAGNGAWMTEYEDGPSGVPQTVRAADAARALELAAEILDARDDCPAGCSAQISEHQAVLVHLRACLATELEMDRKEAESAHAEDRDTLAGALGALDEAARLVDQFIEHETRGGA